MAYYNARVFGKPWILPYRLNRAKYAVAPVFPWQPLSAVPQYNHIAMRDFYLGFGLDAYKSAHTIAGRFEQTVWKMISFWQFFVGPALTLPFLVLAGLCGDSRVRFLLIVGGSLRAHWPWECFSIRTTLRPEQLCSLSCWCSACAACRIWRRHGNRTGFLLVRCILPISAVMLLVVACAPAYFCKTLARL